MTVFSSAYAQDAKHMEKQWGRHLAAYSDVVECVICSVWADDALTGWVLYIPSPVILEFREEKCLGVPFEAWLKLKQLGDETATPFRVVAKGKNLIAKPFMPHVALKHAVKQNDSGGVYSAIPLKEFKIV